MRRGMILGGMLLATPALAGQAPSWMKPGPGQETTATTCGICHTPEYIRMNSAFLTPDQWKAEVTKMQKAYGAPMDDNTVKEIADYLGKNYAR